MPTLVFEIEDGSQVVAPLGDRTTIGSADGNDIVAEREGIAPHHAELFRGMDNTWWVRDRNSAAGTLVNGARVFTHRLLPGDRLYFGSISARFSLEAGEVATKAREAPGHPSAAIDRDLERKTSELSELGNVLARAKAQFEKTVKEQAERLAALREQATKLESAVGSRRQELSALGSALTDAQARMDKAAKIEESRVAQLQEQASRLESDISRKQQQITSLTGTLRDAEKTADKSKNRVGGLREKRRKREELRKSVPEATDQTSAGSRGAEAPPSEQQPNRLAELERIQRQVADLESRRAAAASGLEQHEAGRRRAEESLKLATLQIEQANAELKSLSGEKTSLSEEVRCLGEQRGGLGSEIAVLEARKTELRDLLDGLDRNHAEAVKKFDAVAEKLKLTAAQHEQVLADIEKATASKAQLQAEAAQIAAHIQNAQSELESHASANKNLIALNRKLEGEVAAVGNRLAELSGTEERLARLREELELSKAAHLSLTSVLGELTGKHHAAEQAARELESYTAGLNETRDRLEAGLPALKSAHAEAQKEFAAFKGEAEESRRALTDEVERLRADASRERIELGNLQQEAVEARLRHTELEKQNRELEAATERFAEVQTGIQAAEIEKNKVEAKAQALRKACSDTQLRLTELERAEKSAGQRVSHLTSQETKLQQVIKQLGDKQQRERKRHEELRNLSENAEQEGARQKEQLGARIVQLRAEIARLETRLAHARSWHAELDELYEKLGKLTDASPEAREVWLEIKRRKSDITEQLPSGIQVRPQSRPTVVPRGR